MSLQKRNKILEELYLDKDVNKAFGKMQPEELRDDLKAEVFLVLAELPYNRLIEMYERGEVKFYLVRVMFNMIRSTDKKFFKKYRDFVELPDGVEKQEPVAYSLDKEVVTAMESLYWYDKEMFLLYVGANNNAKEISRVTSIPYLSVVRTINKVKKYLRSNIRNQNV